ncbi:MAG: hypothetical protein U0Q03_21695 [Acidimicrobiales bacterium]
MSEPTEPTTPDAPVALRRPAGRARARSVIAALIATIVFASALVAAVLGMRTASGRFAGTTRNDGSLLTAAVVDLRLTGDAADASDPATSTGLAIDASNLLPGDAVERCLEVRYQGDLDDVDVRLTGRLDGGTGLDRYLAADVELGRGTDPACTDFASDHALFAGTLRDLADGHGSFDTGVAVMDDAVDGATTTVRIRVALVDDDAAQGLDTAFWLVVEARP